jgi:hypothetical protein
MVSPTSHKQNFPVNSSCIIIGVLAELQISQITEFMQHYKRDWLKHGERMCLRTVNYKPRRRV